MGVFDSNQSNRRYNDAIPNYDVDDGVDIVECSEDCPYRDEDRGICTFETCIINQHPFSMPYHSKVTKTCDICGEKKTIQLDEFASPIVMLTNFMCDDCKAKLRNIINEG